MSLVENNNIIGTYCWQNMQFVNDKKNLAHNVPEKRKLFRFGQIDDE